MKRLLAQLVIVVTTGCALVPASAGVIHKWVDADGVTHYSDEAPAAVETPVTRIELPEARTARVDVEGDYYSIANQWARLHRERLAREKLMLEAARQKAQRQPQVTNVYINEAGEERYAAVSTNANQRKSGSHRQHKKRQRKSRHSFGQRSGKFPVGLHPSRFNLRGSY